MDDNLNTAKAEGAIFNLVRDGNIAMDQGRFREGNRAAFLDTLERWDRVFAVLDDTDHAKMKQFGLIKEAVQFVKSAADLQEQATAGGNGYASAVLVDALSQQEIEKRLAARERARRGGDFAQADSIREELLKAGVILEDTKSGTRWKRK
jgi:cysteinyl-tRNA synthetase